MHIRSLAVVTFMLAAVLAGCGQEAESRAAAQSTAVQSFTEVHAIGQTDKIASYADAATLERQGGTVTLWLLTVYAPETEPDPGVRFIEARERYDCDARTKTLLTIRAIHRDGSTVTDFTFDSPKARAFNPTGVFGLSAQIFCEPGELEARRVVADYRRDGISKLKLD